MKSKHLAIRIEQCLMSARASSCVVDQRGALLLDRVRNVVLMDGYNGGPRGGTEKCGPGKCLRGGLHDNESVELGCHHAEWNVICAAAATGTPCSGSWLFVTHMPCLVCAKLIHHAEIEKVIIIGEQRVTDLPGKNLDGVDYLSSNGVMVEWVKPTESQRKMHATEKKA